MTIRMNETPDPDGLRDALRPHDLLWLDASSAPEGLPAWCRLDWPAVVRRDAASNPQRVPVGFRGTGRAQRHADWVDRAVIVRRLSPEALVQKLHGSDLMPLASQLQVLRMLAPWFDDIGLPWGPTGSAGFALATGAAVLRPGSDLDLLVRAAHAPSGSQVAGLRCLQDRAGCRLDIQVDTGRGGFALNEWLAGPRRVLLKTARGPVLVADPWSDAETETAES